MPSRTSSVRFSRSAMRSDCSLWRNRRPKRVSRAESSASSPAWPNGRMAGVVAEADRLDEVLVEPQRPRDDARDRRRLERVRDARAVVVAGRVDEDLRLPLQAPERLRVDDPVAVALERRPHRRFLLGPQPPARLVRAHGERREPRLLSSRMRAANVSAIVSGIASSLIRRSAAPQPAQMMIGTVPPSALHAAPVT